eukprot:2556287-Alexandrium_andersonii.AAC.1
MLRESSPFAGMLRCNAPQNGRAQRRWVFSRPGCLALALQLVVLAPARAVESPPCVLASKAHALQRIASRTRPTS